MKGVADKLYLAVEKIYWADTRSRMVIALFDALPQLEAIDEDEFENDADKKTFRYIREVAREYADVRVDFSSDVRNEVRDALHRLLDLYKRCRA